MFGECENANPGSTPSSIGLLIKIEDTNQLNSVLGQTFQGSIFVDDHG
jgi:hypothetical protein